MKAYNVNQCKPCKPSNPLISCRSRELRGGILYTDCYCLRRNGLQYDCRRTGCQNSLKCETLPAPLCDPANVACIKHCANPHAQPLCAICDMRKCSPCGPMVCYKYEDCGPPKGKSADGAPTGELDDAKKKDDKENQLKRTKSRELRGGIMYYSCHCIKRNGLQHDCRRTGCGGEPTCLVLPDPLCAPSQLARARGLADPAPLAAHLQAQSGGVGAAESSSGGGGGKRFIVCELKGVVPDATSDKGGKCCKCPTSLSNPVQNTLPGNKAVCICPKPSNVPRVPDRSANLEQSSNCKPSMFVFDEATIQEICKKFQDKEINSEEVVRGPGGRVRKIKKEVKEEPCTRPGCVHWKPPPPCVWNAPCKADCFETPVGIQPKHNLIPGGSGFNMSGSPMDQKFILLTPTK